MPGTELTNLYGTGWLASGPTEIGDSGISRRIVIAIDDELWDISPSETPFLVLANKVGTRPVPQPRFDWMEDAAFNLRTFKAKFVVSEGAADCAAWLKLITPSDVQGLEAPQYWQAAGSYDLSDMLLYRLDIDDSGTLYTAWVLWEKAAVDNVVQWRTIDLDGALGPTAGTIPLGATIDPTADPVGYFMMIGSCDGGVVFNFAAAAVVDVDGWHHDSNGTIKTNECIILDTAAHEGTNDGVLDETDAPALVTAADAHDFAGGGAGTLTEYDCYVRVYTPNMFQTGFPEGSGLPQESHRGVSHNYGYTQIFKTSYSHTNTDAATQYVNGPDEWVRKKLRKTREHKLDMEQAFIFQGAPTIDDPYSESPTRTTGGLGLGITTAASAGYIRTYNPDIISGATTHAHSALLIDDAAGTFFSHMNDACELMFEDHVNGSGEKVFMGGSKWATLFYEAGAAATGFQWEPGTGANKTYGFTINTLHTPHGVLKFVKHPFFHGYWENYGLVIDPKNISFRHLRNTKMVPNAQGNDEDQYREYLITEAGLQVKHEQTHAILKLY
jgi:hypothetical protein